MLPEEFEERLLEKPESVKEFPFGPEAAVFKVCGKMFALMMEHRGNPCANLKSEPDEALSFRSQYPSITPGYHMNKEHWNTVILNGDLPDDLFQYLIDESYRLVVSGLKKSDRERIRRIAGIE